MGRKIANSIELNSIKRDKKLSGKSRFFLTIRRIWQTWPVEFTIDYFFRDLELQGLKVLSLPPQRQLFFIGNIRNVSRHCLYLAK